MKRLLSLIMFTACLGLAVYAPPARADTSDFYFTSFTGDYYLSRDTEHISHLKVVEKLVATFPLFDQNHGILRAIPKTANGHSVHTHIESVVDEQGNQLSYDTSTQNDNLVLKIGDADSFVHGQKTYIITYTTDNVTSQPGSYDGHFWDVNGDGWPQTFNAVTATVHLTPELTAALEPSHTRCFTGARGSTASNCTITTSGNETQVVATHPLVGNQTLTYELGFASGTFAAYTIPRAELIRRIALGVAGVVPGLVALWYGLHLWRRKGRDPKGRGVIVPEYVPPKNLSVLGASALLNEGFKPKAISAQILDLAVRKYVKVYEVTDKHIFKDGRHFELELLQPSTGLAAEEAAVLTMLFGDNPATGSRVNLEKLANKLYKPAAALGETVDKSLVTAGLFQATPAEARRPLMITGWIVGICGFFFIPYSLGLLVAGAILLLISYAMPARTAPGVAIKEQLLGLKQYIGVAEAERIRIMQSPQGSLIEKIDVNDTTQLVKLYERLLPYAMLFGLEKDWAKTLAPLYHDASPDWYAGSHAFNAAYFAGSLSGFTTASTSSFSSPSSSGSGGSAGGGGGGGGGGGW